MNDLQSSPIMSDPTPFPGASLSSKLDPREKKPDLRWTMVLGTAPFLGYLVLVGHLEPWPHAALYWCL